MNLHLPQSLDAQAELASLMAVEANMISTQTGRPMMSLHQDSLLAIYLMTQPHQSFPVDTAVQFAYDLPGFHAILAKINQKQQIFKGTELFSILFPTNFHYAKAGCRIENGQIVYCPNGISKDQIGPKNEGIMHVLHRYHGSGVCVQFLDHAQTMLRRFMEYEGFTVGIQDCMLVAPKPILGAVDYQQDEIIARIELQKEMMAIGDSIQKNPMAVKNRFTLMMKAGSKGSSTNLTQICGIVGQQLVNGQRIHNDFPDRSLAHFQKFDNSATARGYVQGNYIHGLNPIEFFFHAAGGREGLTDTAIKTSDTGYLYRKLEKSTESICVRYDHSVRNCNEDVVQIVYGEDSVDPVFVVKSDLPITAALCQTTKYSSSEEEVAYWQCLLQPLWDHPPAHERTTTEWLTAVDVAGLCRRIQKPSNQHQIMFHELRNRFQNLYRNITHQSLKPSLIFQIHVAFHMRLQIVEGYSEMQLDTLFETIELRYLQSLVCPGEPVGGLCASACSAPATQMTLNTFHLAGTGSKVTSGLKRLAELYNDSAPHHTSLMIFLKDSTTPKRQVRELADRIKAVTLNEAITRLQVLHSNLNMESLQLRYPFMVTWQKIYQHTPQGIQFNLNRSETNHSFLAPFYVEMEIDRKLLLRLDLTLSDLRRMTLEHFPQLLIIAGPQYDDKLILLIFLPNDPNEEYIRPKKKESSRKTSFQEEETPNLQTVMESWEFWNKYQSGLWETVLISGESDIRDTSVEKMPFRDEYYIQAVGNNITGLANFEEIDENKTILDQVQITSDLLGIEAARAVLYTEISEVLANAGVVDPRHILLLVDTMTYHGDVAGTTRHSMAKSDLGFIEKSCFESGDKFLLHAAVTNQLDDMKGISAQVAFGLKARVGTGAFELYLDEKSIVGNVIEHDTQNDQNSEESEEEFIPSYY